MRHFAVLELLDLYDKEGRISHKKLLPLILFVAVFVFQALHNQFSAAILVILGALAFGPRMFGLVVDAKQHELNAVLNQPDDATPAPSAAEPLPHA